jgi:hypothetical protein
VFLAHPNGPARLIETDRASECNLKDGSTLLLMCSFVAPT